MNLSSSSIYISFSQRAAAVELFLTKNFHVVRIFLNDNLTFNNWCFLVMFQFGQSVIYLKKKKKNKKSPMSSFGDKKKSFFDVPAFAFALFHLSGSIDVYKPQPSPHPLQPHTNTDTHTTTKHTLLEPFCIGTGPNWVCTRVQCDLMSYSLEERAGNTRTFLQQNYLARISFL